MSKFKLRLAVTTAAAICSVGVSATALTGTATAATDGQQIALNIPYGHCGAYGPAADVTITGNNQNGRSATWRGGYSYIFPNGAYIRNWWWRGQATVTWRKAGTNNYYRTTAFVPQWDDQTFQTSPNIVTIDCRGSLRKVSAQATVNGTPGTIWACGGWRDGGGLTDTIYYKGYDEYSTQYAFTWSLGPGGVGIPAIITWWGRAPNC